jgi:hypothetical protein
MMQETLRNIQRSEVTDVMDLKGILLHNAEREGGHYYIEVPKSRFRKILSDYWALLSIEIEGALDNYAENYKSYYLSNLNGKTNSYKIIKTKEVEKKGSCEECNCSKKRWINPRTGICYYNEMISKDYTTKINI